MENERVDPPLSLLYSHQVPRYKCAECDGGPDERTAKATDLIKSILAKAATLFRHDTDGDSPGTVDE